MHGGDGVESLGEFISKGSGTPQTVVYSRPEHLPFSSHAVPLISRCTIGSRHSHRSGVCSRVATLKDRHVLVSVQASETLSGLEVKYDDVS